MGKVILKAFESVVSMDSNIIDMRFYNGRSTHNPGDRPASGVEAGR